MFNTIVSIMFALMSLLVSSGCCSAQKNEHISSDTPPRSSSANPGFPLIKPSQITASSKLKAKDQKNYGIDRAFDGSRQTAWCEGAQGNGVGQSIDLKFNTPTHIEALAVDAGFVNMSPTEGDLFTRNAHLKTFRLFVDGALDRTVQVGQHQPAIAIELHREVSSIRFEVVEVWTGKPDTHLGAFDDLCISEIAVFGPKP